MTATIRMVPPNGGYGWVIVFGCALTNVFNQALSSVFGLLFGDFLISLGEETTGAGLVINTCFMTLNFTGLLAGTMIKKYSYRKTAVLGACFTSFGMVLCSFVTQTWQLLICYGIFVGIGLGLISPSSFVAINSYFTTKKGRAVGLYMAGTGFGQMLMPQIVRYLLANYGYHGTTLIIGALCLNGLIGTGLLHPVEWHLKEEVEEEKPKNNIEAGIGKEEQPKISINMTNNEKKNDLKDNRWYKKIVELLELQLLNRFSFWSIMIGLSLTYTSYTNFSLLFPYYLQFTAGLNKVDVANCMTILSAADLLSRLTLPTMTEKFKISYRKTFMLAAVATIIVRSVLAETTGLIELFITSAFYGLARALIITNQNLSITEYCSAHDLKSTLPNALGLNMAARGLFAISVGQILGFIRDYYQSYSLCLHAQNVLLLIMIFLWLPSVCNKKK